MRRINLEPCGCGAGERRPYVREWIAGLPAFWHAQVLCPACGARSAAFAGNGTSRNERYRAREMACKAWNDGGRYTER